MSAITPMRPRPVIEPVAAPFWNALAQQRLLVQWCSTCERGIHYPRIHCPHCLSSDLGWRECSGHAVLVAFTTVYRHADPYFKALAPYVVGLVRLDEGVTLMSNIVGVDPTSAEIRIGMKLRVGFNRIDESVTLHEFRPAGADR